MAEIQDIEDLKVEADSLGITYSANIGATKLQARIDEYYANESKSADIAVEKPDDSEEEPEVTAEVTPTKPKAKTGKAVEELGVVDVTIDNVDEIVREAKEKGVALTPALYKAINRAMTARAAQTEIVKVTMVDKREASTATAAYFNNGIHAMRVPLDTWVEMPRSLIYMADTQKALIHINTDKGAIPKYTKKYVVEYKNRKL